jgi:lipopolysaccharide assembly protein A
VLVRYVKLALIILITLTFVAFSVANRAAVSISFFPLPYTADMPVFLMAILCFALGIIVAGLIMSLKVMKVNHRAAKEHKRVMALQNEIKSMQVEQQKPLPAAQLSSHL